MKGLVYSFFILTFFLPVFALANGTGIGSGGSLHGSPNGWSVEIEASYFSNAEYYVQFLDDTSVLCETAHDLTSDVLIDSYDTGCVISSGFTYTDARAELHLSADDSLQDATGFGAQRWGCTEPEAEEYDSEATVDDGSCGFDLIYGCTDFGAVNYDPSATADDGSCVFDISSTTLAMMPSYYDWLLVNIWLIFLVSFVPLSFFISRFYRKSRRSNTIRL